MVMVSISETYDLHTKVNKMTLIGIHTPTKGLIQKTYPGLCMNCKYFRVSHVDFALATAQQLPLGVGEIGLDQDQIRPQDVMNPILYKAVSNDSWSTLEARLAGLRINRSGPIGTMAEVEDENVTGLADEHGVYYSLLSNRDGFRIAGSQQGVTMKGLVPLVFDKWYTHGENALVSHGDGAPVIAGNAENDAIITDTYVAGSMRGRPHPMPKINTTYVTGLGNLGIPGAVIGNGMGNETPLNAQAQMPDIPPVMLAAIVLPPSVATTGILYYRLVVRAYIEFTEVRPIQEITSFAQMHSEYAPYVYHTDYTEQSKHMDMTTDMADVQNADIQKIMEGR